MGIDMNGKIRRKKLYRTKYHRS